MFCEKCGNSLGDEMKFCDKCGNSVKAIVNENEKEVKKSKNYLGAFASVFVFLLVFGVVRFITQEGTKALLTNNSTETIEESLTKALPEMNKDLPKKVDEITQLTSITSSGRNISYNYKIDDKGLKITQNDLDVSMRSDVVKGICTQLQTKTLADKGVVFLYNYYKNSGLYIGTLSVSSSDCK